MRIKGGTVTKRRHKKVLKATKGYRMTKNRLYKVAHEAYMHAGQYAYNHRQRRQSQMRQLWITRISGAVESNGISYSKFLGNLKKYGSKLDRKVLAELANTDLESFQNLLKEVNKE